MAGRGRPLKPIKRYEDEDGRPELTCTPDVGPSAPYGSWPERARPGLASGAVPPGRAHRQAARGRRAFLATMSG